MSIAAGKENDNIKLADGHCDRQVSRKALFIEVLADSEERL